MEEITPKFESWAIVELHKDGWVKVQVPNGGYMDTQILGEKVGVGYV